MNRDPFFNNFIEENKGENQQKAGPGSLIKISVSALVCIRTTCLRRPQDDAISLK